MTSFLRVRTQDHGERCVLSLTGDLASWVLAQLATTGIRLANTRERA